MKLYYHDNYIEYDNLITLLHFGWNYDLMIELHNEYNLVLPKDYQELYLSVQNDKDLDKEKMDYFITTYKYKGRQLSVGEILDIMIVSDEPLSYEEKLIAFRSVDGKVIRSRMMRNLFDFKEDDDELEAVQKGNMEDGLKWNVYYLLHHLEETYHQFADFLEACYSILKERLAPYNKRTYEWGQLLKERALNENHEGHEIFMKQLELMQLDRNEIIHFGPQGIAPFNFDSSTHSDTNASYAFLGELSDVIVEQFTKGVSDEWLIEIAKLLQEEKRLDMIKIYAVEQVSGVEMSKRLGISQSTITHHLTNMLINKLLLERYYLKEKRYHHQVNRDLLKDWCDFVKGHLHLTDESQVIKGELAQFFKCLADPMRWDMLKAIAKEPLTSVNLRELTGISAGTVSHHMNLMSDVGIVTKTKEGRSVFFSLNHEVFNGYLNEILSI